MTNEPLGPIRIKGLIRELFSRRSLGWGVSQRSSLSPENWVPSYGQPTRPRLFLKTLLFLYVCSFVHTKMQSLKTELLENSIHGEETVFSFQTGKTNILVCDDWHCGPSSPLGTWGNGCRRQNSDGSKLANRTFMWMYSFSSTFIGDQRSQRSLLNNPLTQTVRSQLSFCKIEWYFIYRWHSSKVLFSLLFKAL